jgi:hypothetical protein
VWYFLALMAVVAVGLIWNHRRNAARREAASRERFAQMLEAGVSPAVPAAEVVPPAAPPSASAGDVPPDAIPALTYVARPSVLTPAEKLIYYLLRAGLPDLEVFPKVPLAVVIEAPGTGYDRELQLRRLSRQVVDFVVCDKKMKVVAAVQLAAIGPEAVIAQRIRSECLKSAGIRLVTVQPAALPKRAEVRAFICGAAAPSGPL